MGGNGDLSIDAKSERKNFPGNEGEMGVEHVTEENLGADRDDFSDHSGGLSHGQNSPLYPNVCQKVKSRTGVYPQITQMNADVGFRVV